MFSVRSLFAPTTALAAGVLGLMSVAQAQTYALDPGHTFVTWEARHIGLSTSRGRFEKKEGSISFDLASKTGKVDISIDMNAMTTGIAPFDKNLKGPNFFDAEKFPTSRFLSSKFQFEGDKLVEVQGELTLIGSTQPVTLKVQHFGCVMSAQLKREVCGGDFETTISRSQFGMKYLVPAIPDSIRLLIQIEASKQ